MEKFNFKQLFSLRGIYYICTLIIVLLVGIMGGLVDVLQTKGVIEAATHLGYPLYFFTLLGVFKIMGGVALLLPKFFGRYTNIAYCGFGFDFIFASYSHYSVGDDLVKIIVPLVFLGILLISYLLKNRA